MLGFLGVDFYAIKNKLVHRDYKLDLIINKLSKSIKN